MSGFDKHYTNACVALSKYLKFKHEFNGDHEDPRWFWIPPDEQGVDLDDIPVRILIRGKLTGKQKQSIDDLIAAAPEMLEVLKEAHKVVSFVNTITPNHITFDRLCIEMEAAITKAEGRQG